MPEIRNADFFDSYNCNILSQLMPEEMKSYMRDFINGNLFMNPVGKAMEKINGLMGDNLSIIEGLNSNLEGLESLAEDLTIISNELQAFTDHTNRLSGISVDSVKANFSTTFNVMAGFNAMVDTFKNSDELLEDNFNKAFSSLNPNIIGPFTKDITGNLGKINSVLKEIQRQCSLAGGPAGDACNELVSSLSSITQSLQSSIANIKGIMDQDNAAFAVALAALERYALGNTLISSALQDPCFSGALAKNLIMNPEGAFKLDEVAKKFGKEIPGSRPLLADFFDGGDDEVVSENETEPAATEQPTSTTEPKITEGNVATSESQIFQEIPPNIAAPPTEDYVSYPAAFPTGGQTEETEPTDFVSLPPEEQKQKITSTESHPDETDIVYQPPKPCGSHIGGFYLDRDFDLALLETLNSLLPLGKRDFKGGDDDAILINAARELFYVAFINQTTVLFETIVYQRKPEEKQTDIDIIHKLGDSVIRKGLVVQKRTKSNENWELTENLLKAIVEGKSSYGLKPLISAASKDYCGAIGYTDEGFTIFDATASSIKDTAEQFAREARKDMIPDYKNK